ncbi:MAG: hypothetical protein AB7E95_01090 [Kiritimatiellales bacterium]
MNISAILFLSIFGLIFFLFPMLCAILMKRFCKNFSDQFIIRFLGISCSIPLTINIYLNVLRENVLQDLGIPMYGAMLITGFSFLLYYFFCQLLAKAGVIIMNRNNPNQAIERYGKPRQKIN